jgi:hypothetical protein
LRSIRYMKSRRRMLHPKSGAGKNDIFRLIPNRGP